MPRLVETERNYHQEPKRDLKEWEGLEEKWEWEREGDVNVGRLLTSLIAIATLRSTVPGDVNPQVTSHVLGLLKCHSLSDREIQASEIELSGHKGNGGGGGWKWLTDPSSSAEGIEYVLGVVDLIMGVEFGEVERRGHEQHIRVEDYVRERMSKL